MNLKAMQKEAIFSILKIAASRPMEHNKFADLKTAIEFVSPVGLQWIPEDSYDVDELLRVDTYMLLGYRVPTAIKFFRPLAGIPRSQYSKVSYIIEIEVFELDLDWNGCVVQHDLRTGESKPVTTNIPSCLIAAKLDSIIH